MGLQEAWEPVGLGPSAHPPMTFAQFHLMALVLALVKWGQDAPVHRAVGTGLMSLVDLACSEYRVCLLLLGLCV